MPRIRRKGLAIRSPLAARKDVQIMLECGHWYLFISPPGTTEAPTENELRVAWNEIGGEIIANAPPGETLWALRKFGQPHNDE